jgi:magnesium transporter
MSDISLPKAEKPHRRAPRVKGRRTKRHHTGAGTPALPRVTHVPTPGSAAGIEYHELIQTTGVAAARVVCTDYCAEQMQVQEVTDIAAFLAVHRPAWSHVRWIHVEGLQDRGTIRALAEKYQLHPLAIEDALDGHHRPKAEDYPGIGDLPGRLFVASRPISSWGVTPS